MAAVKSVLFCLLAVATSGVQSDTCVDDLKTCRDRGINQGQDQCGNLASWINCVSNTGEDCPLEENSGVTFQSLQKVAKNSCAVLATVTDGQEQCEQLQQCLQNITFSSLLQSQDDHLNDTVKTEFWCSALTDPLDCALAAKDQCNFDENKVKNVQDERDKVSQVCRGCGLQGQLGQVFVVLLLASLLRHGISG